MPAKLHAPFPVKAARQRQTQDALTDAALDQASGGTDPAPAQTATSNIMKTKHDTVKNSISNIR